MRQLNERRENLEKEAVVLRKQKESIEQIGKAEEKVLEFCQRVRLNLHSLGYDERQLLLEALSVKVIAYRDRVELRYALPT